MRPGGGAPDTPGWSVRVVPNLYPALSEAGAPPSSGGTASEAGSFASSGDPLLTSRRSGEPDLFSSRPATGAHEVIINAPEHLTSIAELGEQRLATAVGAWRERMRVHSNAAYVQLIVNEGAGAGASLEHTHAQLYAMPFVPAVVARERERHGAYRERSGEAACSATSWSRRFAAASAWLRSMTRRRSFVPGPRARPLSFGCSRESRRQALPKAKLGPR